MSQQCPFAANASGNLDCIRQSVVSRSTSIGETTPGVLCPVLGSPSKREIWIYWSESNIGLQKCWSTAAPLLWGEAEKAVTAQPGETEAQGGSHPSCPQIPEGRVQRGWIQALFSGTQCQDKRQWTQSRTQEVHSDHQAVLPCCLGDGAPAQAAQKGYGVSSL